MAVSEHHDLAPEEQLLDTLPVKSPADIEPRSSEQIWLIHDLWGRSAVGLIGGPAKCGKSWLGLDMAVSIASATDCLGRFPVEYPGRTLIYLAEDSPAIVRDRIEAICAHRGLDIRLLLLEVIIAPTVRLDLPEDRIRLINTIQSEQPCMLLLDPLVRLHRLNENDASDISGLLGFLRELQRAFDLAVVLVHHTSKKHHANPGQALRGSSDLHAFGDSNLYLARKNEKLSLTIEHRAARSPDPLTLQLVSRSDGTATHLEVVSDQKLSADNHQEPTALKDSIIEFLDRSGSARYRSQIRTALKVNNQRLGHALGDLEDQGLICRTSQGWKLPRPSVEPATEPASTTSSDSMSEVVACQFSDPNQLELIG